MGDRIRILTPRVEFNNSMHIYFIRNGITTYQYIINKRNKKIKEKGIKNISFENENRLKSASTVVTVTDVGMGSK